MSWSNDSLFLTRRSTFVMVLLSLPRDLDFVVYSHVNNSDLYCLSWTCWQAYDRVTYFLHFAFRFHRFLARYFPGDKLHSILELQKTTGFLISGDALLYFLGRSERISETLEVYAPARHAFQVIKWITHSQYGSPADSVCFWEQVSRLRFDVPSAAGTWSPLLLSGSCPGTSISFGLVSKNTPFKIIVHLTQQALIQLVLQSASSMSFRFLF